MSEDIPGATQDAPKPDRLDPAFFTCVNEILELANRQANQQGLKRISLASLHAVARFNAHGFLEGVGGEAATQRTGFLDYMTHLYRRLLNDQLDALGAERGIDVGESELAEEYRAAGYVPGKGFVGSEPA
jgi:hypothetical protein